MKENPYNNPMVTEFEKKAAELRKKALEHDRKLAELKREQEEHDRRSEEFNKKTEELKRAQAEHSKKSGELSKAEFSKGFEEFNRKLSALKGAITSHKKKALDFINRISEHKEKEVVLKREKKEHNEKAPKQFHLLMHESSLDKELASLRPDTFERQLETLKELERSGGTSFSWVQLLLGIIALLIGFALFYIFLGELIK